MARLNEPPVSADSLETLRRKLLRQNRDLAKSNNVRALRIRELENDCACMLSENLELRGRILELEKELEDNDARRIADHALAIKEKLESQLTEWGTLLAGLGLEPPMKRHSPRIRRTSKPRLSFSSARPSPSQRRLRDVARDIEELGHISEQKLYPRMSMNPEQILALRSEADSMESPELGPPPMSQFIDEDPVKVDSPCRPQSSPSHETPKIKMEPSVALESPQSAKFLPKSPSPEKRKSLPAEPEVDMLSPAPSEQPPAPAPQPAKAGSKRKLAARDDMTTPNPQRTGENVAPRVIAEKQSIRDKVGNKTLKELANSRKETREKAASAASRKPLAVKSTNDDVCSPKKAPRPAVTDEVAAAKADLVKSRASLDRTKSRTKNPAIMVDTVVDTQPSAPRVMDFSSDLAIPVAEPAILSPCSPDPASTSRGGTPPPADINGNREASRPSRRNRTAVSYAEPNLRDKMRRPTKELLDAVSGEGKYVRRSSQAEPVALDTEMMKKENALPTSWKKLPPAPEQFSAPGDAPASPLAGKGSPSHILPSFEKGRRTSMLVKETVSDREDDGNGESKLSESSNPDSSNMSEVDIYEFTISSPQPEKEAVPEPRKKAGGRRVSRRVSSAVTAEDGLAAKERAASRRRSMML